MEEGSDNTSLAHNTCIEIEVELLQAKGGSNMEKAGADNDGVSKRVQFKRTNNDDNSSSDCNFSSLSRGRTMAARVVHPFQEILEEHGEFGFNSDIFETATDGDGTGDTAATSSTRDAVPSSEEVKIQHQSLEGEARDAWRGLEDALGREFAVDDDTESAPIATEDSLVSSASEGGEQTVDTRALWRGLEEALYEEFATEFTTEEDNNATESAQNNGSADTNCHCQPQPDNEELMNAVAIQNALSNDKDEILSENAADREGEDASITEDDEEDDDDNAQITMSPGAHHVYPSRPTIAEDSREGDQNDLDSSDVVYDIFDSPETPYVAVVILEAVPVDAASSFGYCANVNSAAVPPSAMSFTSELKNKDTLLRRQALVDDIIYKLQESSLTDASEDCDESQNVVLLRGYGGIGKSVLCSMVVSNRSTLLHFADGIAWLSLSQLRGEGTRGGMTYDVYVDFLESICNQLDLEVPSFNEPIVLASDTSSIRRQKEQAAMEAAKTVMCRLLSNRHLLIVLDDVWSRSAIPWLNFSNRLDSHLQVLLSTRLRGGFRKAKAIDVGTLSLQEARTLLISESGCADLSIEEELLAVDIVKRCSLPVAICIAGRRLASSYDRHGTFQELANEMSDVLAHQIDPQHTMFYLTDRCFAGVGGESLKVSFVAFSVTFTTNKGKRTPVTAAAATKLLDALLLPEDMTDLGCFDGTVLILQQLRDMGLLERQGDMFKVRHDSGQEYAKQIMEDKRERAMLFTKRLSRAMGKKLASKSTKSAKTLASALHLLFSIEYTSEISIESHCQTIADDGYLFFRLPWHVMSSTRQSHRLAGNILCSPSFLKRRVDAMGLLPCIKAHIHDIEMLDAKSHATKEKKDFQGIIDTSFEVISDFIATEGVASHDAGKAYMLLALYFQHEFRFFNAMEMYSRAYVSFQQEGLDEEVEWVKKRVEKIAFKPVCLVPKSSSSEDIIRFDHVEVLLAQQERAATGDANSNTCISSNVSLDAGTKLTLSSHPGMALCISDMGQHLPGFDCHTLCIGPAESALSVKYEEDRFMACHGGKSCLITGASRGGEGDMLYKINYRYNNKTFSRMIDSMFGNTQTSDLVVNEDGSMSPRSRRDLVFAARLPQLHLVKRDSPCRLILKHGNDLKSNQVPSISQDYTLSPVSRDKIFSGELASHSGNAICHHVEIKPTSKLAGDQMKFGDVSDSAKFVYDGEKLATVIDGKYKYFLTKALGYGDTSANLYLVRDESRVIFKHEFEFGLHWIINDDGSLSPAAHPTHAIGLHSLSSAELLLTEEQMMLAKGDAKRLIRKNRRQSWKHNLRFIRLVSK